MGVDGEDPSGIMQAQGGGRRGYREGAAILAKDWGRGLEWLWVGWLVGRLISGHNSARPAVLPLWRRRSL